MDRRLKHKIAAQKGLTLIELLVVMLIIAMSASVVILNLPPPTSKARAETDRFAARLNAAAERAVTTGSLIGLELTQSDYRFFYFERGEWRRSGNAHLSGGAFPAGVSIGFELPEKARRNEEAEPEKRDDDAPAPNVFFSPTGETTALEMRFRTQRARMKLTLDGAGGVKVANDDDNGE